MTISSSFLNENSPFASIFFNGILLLLINFKGKIIYCQNKGNNFFHSLSSIKNENLLNYLKEEEEDYKLLFSFFNSNFNLTIFKQLKNIKEYQTK